MTPYSEVALPGFAFAHLYPCVDSTMNVARLSCGLLSAREPLGVIMALEQTDGKGRQGRRWIDGGGAFMATFLLRTTLPVASLSGYSLAVGVYVARAIERLGGSVQLKWPNDLVVMRNDAMLKLGGILTDVNESAGTRIILVGIGINLKGRPSEIDRAVALSDRIGRIIRPEEFLPVLADEVRTGHATFERDGFSSFRTEFEEHCCLHGIALTLDLSGETISGPYAGIGESGSLLLSLPEGIREIHAGHVVSWQKV